MSLKRPLRLLLLGAPGSGKGTQTSRLLKRFPQLHSISSGDMLRQEIKNESELGKLASSYIAQGKLVPDDLITKLVVTNLLQLGWLKPSATWLLDGFPRTCTQAEILDQDLYEHSAPLNMVVELDVPESVILERIENRYVHIPSGRVYNLQYNPPKVPGKDDITGEPLTKRSDDTAEVFSNRLKQYRETVGPLKEHYQKQGILSKVSGETSDIIFPKLLELIESKFGSQ
ncbi:ADK2 (YER170W) [Zygosaccharomyces parabailii]|uniref:GTP:AMP phosphotransferase, mitochondrial n=1 Tax=Zygosaccharomyces bailii (strain CLIB 213 / ATCC 58445 / CBS 680 / BCRC 21525 / NBRC 1098 / NCYC 1416 / NRRL Y-2227) TaxID=1333698 RepID=A0A8J2X9C4_ZYGB2|nr:ADK2 (YER170W) [Zygosaccharomyces parabailii]CDF88497.1 BN860_11628g1_1 [Zygosaccharomyces bailii CLIB 213]CDH14623.1 probable Adenylate kinase 2 [Zygosaccharomyces bailii ISA1307]SJM82210.1 probable Adenylate kinase 2 [Zygosaccharomyces bailii]